MKTNKLKFKLHYSIGSYDDYIIVDADSIKEIKKIAKKELEEKRGLDPVKNNFWSEKIDD